MGLDEEIEEWGRTREIEAAVLVALIRKCADDDEEEAEAEREDAIPAPVFDELVTPAVY